MCFIVVLDACVLYPAPLRDLLLRLATTGLYAAKWSERIHDEWTRNLVANRPEIAEPIKQTRIMMDTALPDALVTGYEDLIDGLSLPDMDDRHVLATAIRCGAQSIVTYNLKDFPQDVLDIYGIEAVHPDDFIIQQLDLQQGAVISVIKRHRAVLKKLPLSAHEYLTIFEGQGLVVTAGRLKEFVDLI